MLSWQVTVEDFEMVCKGLYRALCIREKYMQKSFQRFPKTPSKYLRNIEGEAWVANESFYPGTSDGPPDLLSEGQQWPGAPGGLVG